MKTEDFVRKVLPPSVSPRRFHLVHYKALKRQRILKDVAENYLPDYVFIETDAAEKMYEILKKTSKRLLFSDD